MDRKTPFSQSARLLVLAGVSLLVWAAGSALFDRISEGMDASPQRLVYHTDHRAVLEACRQVITDPQAVGFPPARNGYTMLPGSQNSGAVPAALPAVLRDLRFEFMDVKHGQAMICFGGGFGHWGFTTSPTIGARDGHWELIPGLWYWNEGGGSLPRDLSTQPYYRRATVLLAGGVAAIAAAIALGRRGRKMKEIPGGPDPTGE